MDNKFYEARKYYQDFYGIDEPVFRIDENSYVYGEGVEIKSSSISELMEKLSCEGKSFRVIMFRNDSGHYDIPDVELLKSEENIDY